MASRWRRPRTKVYDCNFNVAERYYKPVMDSLDRKHGHSSLDPVTPLDERDSTPASRVSRLVDRESSTGRESVGARATRMMAEFENGFESSHKNRASQLRDDEDADAEFEATMKKIRNARKARNAELEEEFDSIGSSSRKNKINLADQLLDSVGLNSKTQRSIEEDVYSKHKRAAKKFFEEDDDSMTKWTVVNPAAKALKDAEDASNESSASARARKSRARLQDIDAELEELDRKSAARQKRIADLKVLMAENDSQDSSSASSVKVTKRITVKQSSEKKQVSF